MNRHEAIKNLEQHKYPNTCGQKSLEESNEAIDMAIETLREADHVQFWRDYTPPKEWGEYLVTYDDGKIDIIKWTDNSRRLGEKTYWHWDVRHEDLEVVAWMPLPEEYVGDDAENLQ